MGKKVLAWTVGAFVIFFIASRPAGAASLTQWIGNGLAHIANGISDFFAGLAPG